MPAWVKVEEHTRLLAQINDFQHGEKPVLKVQVLRRRFGAVVLYKGETSRPQDLVVAAAHAPVKVGHAELVVVDGAVADAEGGPGGEPALQQVGGQHLRGCGPTAPPAQGAREQGDLQKHAVQLPQNSLHDFREDST